MSTNPADGYALRVKRAQEENPTRIDHLDENVIEALPEGTEILSIVPSGASAWCKTFRIDTRLKGGETKLYFLKYESGKLGRRMMEGTYLSESAYAAYAHGHVPNPIGFGEFRNEPDTWFYLREFHNMVDELPDVKEFVEIVAKVHRASMGKSPTGKFGFGVPTHLANIPNDNTWQDTWEKWYTQAMQAMYAFEKQTQGEDEELDTLFDALCHKVIPRLLRPLETGGRSIEACLVHSDLWPGNCMPDADTGEIIMFDSCAYWGHNEADLGPWRAPRYRLGGPYLERYRKVMGMSEPHGDWEDRNALYALRYDFLVSALYPNETKFRQMAKREMRALVEKYPDGLQEEPHQTRDDQSDATKHLGELKLDSEIVSVLPSGVEIVATQYYGVSNWNQTGYIDFRIDKDNVTRWFLKLSVGARGLDMLKGEYESMREICKVAPYFAPRPIYYGSCAQSNRHFFLCEFHDLDTGLPSIAGFAREIATLHRKSTSPNGMFKTTLGPNHGKKFSRGIRSMLAFEEEARGPNQELKELSHSLLEKVIPRLLRPLETQGRTVKPSLLHGDLWIGNIATDKANGQPIVFDSSAYYGHHEYDLSPLRSLNNQWSYDCLEEYHKHIPKDAPVEDWESRNALYALRNQIIDSALYPNEEKYRNSLISEMTKLVRQFSDGDVALYNTTRGLLPSS